MRNDGILRLLHLREQTEAVGETMATESLRFDALSERGPTRAVSSFNLFQTPPDLADQMVGMLGELHGKQILEPSAGLGRLYRAIRQRSKTCPVTLVEQSADCCAELYREMAGDDGAKLIQADFLSCDVDRLGGHFDAVVMNPPFRMGLDIKHIRHAMKFLAPRGVLIALCYAGVKQRKAFYDQPGWVWEDLTPGTFKSEGTRADVAVVRWNPAGASDGIPPFSKPLVLTEGEATIHSARTAKTGDRRDGETYNA